MKMAGYRVEREPNGVRIYKEDKEIFLDQDECNHLAKTIGKLKENIGKAKLNKNR